MSLDEIKQSTPYPSFRQVVATMLRLSVPTGVILFGGAFLFFKIFKLIAPAQVSFIPSIGFLCAITMSLFLIVDYWATRHSLRECAINEKVRTYLRF